MKIFITASLIIAVFAISAFADAKKEYITREHPWTLRSVAALGMGNAYYTKSSDKYAPFYNPAGLSRINRSWRLDIIPVGFSMNKDFQNLYEDANNVDFDNDTEVADFIKEHIGDNAYTGFSFYPSFTKRNLTIGVFTASRATVQPRNPVLPEANISAVADAGIVVGYAHTFFEESLAVGVAARLQGRGSLNKSYTVSDFVSGRAEDDLDNLTAEDYAGTALIFDVGAIYDFGKLLDVDFSPRAGFAVNNIGLKTGSYGNLDIRKRDGDIANSPLPTFATLSFGVSPSVSFLQTDIILDIVDITRNFDEDDDWGKRINIGAEIGFDLPLIRHFKFRGGFHQGYPSVGFGIDFYVVELNYAYYTEELGAYSGQLPDSRHALEISIGI
ncbi:MAG: hypothetical protein LBD73_02830 [Deferribacteraceae bacterium]|jgi:hypothetical protein|nr:hypothetical protein [Deferribacteraceae bacterium]